VAPRCIDGARRGLPTKARYESAGSITKRALPSDFRSLAIAGYLGSDDKRETHRHRHAAARRGKDGLAFTHGAHDPPKRCQTKCRAARAVALCTLHRPPQCRRGARELESALSPLARWSQVKHWSRRCWTWSLHSPIWQAQTIFDKLGYSIFSAPALDARLRQNPCAACSAWRPHVAYRDRRRMVAKCHVLLTQFSAYSEPQPI
jgi:hypothetical protein